MQNQTRKLGTQINVVLVVILAAGVTLALHRAVSAHDDNEFHTEYGTPAAIAEAARKHAILGFVIILAGLFKAAEVQWRGRFRWLAFPWIGMLVIAALLLLSYREPEGAYKTNPSDQLGTTRLLAPKTLTVHFTFTQEELRCDEL